MKVLALPMLALNEEMAKKWALENGHLKTEEPTQNKGLRNRTLGLMGKSDDEEWEDLARKERSNYDRVSVYLLLPDQVPFMLINETKIGFGCGLDLNGPSSPSPQLLIDMTPATLAGTIAGLYGTFEN
jgi:hypothetical protein